MLNVVATLQQRYRNVLITSDSDVVATSETGFGTNLIFGRGTTLWQRWHNVVVPAGEVFRKKDALKIFAKFTEKHLCW